MSWSWSFVPQRLMSEDAFLELSLFDRGVLLSLYLRCDKWGRGPGGLRALATLLGVDRDGLADSMGRLYAAGLVQSLHGDWQIVRYDEDATPAGVLKRRATASAFGQPETLEAVLEAKVEVLARVSDTVRQRPTVSDTVGQRPTKSDNVRRSPTTSGPDETRRDETLAPPGAKGSTHVDSVSAPSQPAPWGGGLGAEAPAPALDPERFRSPPYVPKPGERPLLPAQITEDHPDPAGLAFVPSEKQQACTAMKWGGDHTPEHSAALLAWAKESGVPETRLKLWLVKREAHNPWPEDWPLSKRKRRSKAPEEIYP